MESMSFQKKIVPYQASLEYSRHRANLNDILFNQQALEAYLASSPTFTIKFFYKKAPSYVQSNLQLVRKLGLFKSLSKEFFAKIYVSSS